MPKPLPPATAAALSPPPSAAFPYTFFEEVEQHPFEPAEPALSLRNVWWLMDAAFLAYSPEVDIRSVFARDVFGSAVAVRFFSTTAGTQCYVASANDWIVLAYRGTQVDDFWASVVDWSVDARFLPAPDAHGDLVHSGFLAATRQGWADVAGCIRALQIDRARPLWITGHSLGAALATVAANFCGDEPDGLGLQTTYVYGSPRVGDKNFVHRIQQPLLRVRNSSDLVTQVPIGLLFRHAGMPALVDSAGHWHSDPSPMEEALFEVATAHLSAANSDQVIAMLRAAGPGVQLPGVLADHAPINYAIRLWNCYEEEA
jgi:hypothetical protein